jgi:hypothetical protein
LFGCGLVARYRFADVTKNRQSEVIDVSGSVQLALAIQDESERE